MKVYTGENVRNVAVVGHGHAGKTSLISAHSTPPAPLSAWPGGRWHRPHRLRRRRNCPQDVHRTGLAYAEWGKPKSI